MIRIMLDNATRDELHALRRTDLPAKVRDRIEAALYPLRSGPAPDVERRTLVEATLRELLARRPGPAASSAGSWPSAASPWARGRSAAT
jgi:hypothetical protein